MVRGNGIKVDEGIKERFYIVEAKVTKNFKKLT